MKIDYLSQRFKELLRNSKEFFFSITGTGVWTRDHPYVSPADWATWPSSLSHCPTKTWIYSHWLKWVCLDIWISQRLFQLLLFLLYYTTDSSVLYIIFFIFIQSIDRGIFTLHSLPCFSIQWVSGCVGLLFLIFHFYFLFFYFFWILFFHFPYNKELGKRLHIYYTHTLHTPHIFVWF